jgi:hypothetical protein
MKNLLFLILSLIISFELSAQITQRVEINGRIIVSANDVEGVTVYNSSSNKGTITNNKGEFAIEVRLNDVIEFSALQFEKFIINIDEKILTNRYVTVYLVERINKLDEVVIMPYDMLTGNIIADVKSVETFNPHLDAIYFGVNDIYGIDFTDDYKSEVVNIAMTPRQFEYSPDIVQILGRFLKPVFKTNKEQEENKLKRIKQLDLKDLYGKEFIIHSFNIPEERIEDFVAFVESNQFDYHLLDKGHELFLIEHLYAKSRQFLNADNAKD